MRTPLGHTAFTYCVFDCIRSVGLEDWRNATSNSSLYLSYNYLCGYQDGMSNTTDFRYVLIYDVRGNAVVAFVFQRLRFSLRELLQQRITSKALIFISSLIASEKEISILMCGNLFVSGETGYAHHTSVTKKDALFLIGELIKSPRRLLIFNTSFSFIVFKEFWPSSSDVFSVLRNFNYQKFAIDNNMLLAIHSEWNRFEDYLNSMKTKYRTRAKNVLKKSSEIKSLNLNSEQIQKFLPTIKVLYENVIEKSDYSLGTLSVDTFVKFKRELKEKFVFSGYFLENTLVGFSTAFVDQQFVDANFIGVDYNFVKSHKLYQRILYDFVSFSIDNQTKVLRLGRTAETIKSGVGASPISMYLFAKHSGCLKYYLLRIVLKYVKPENPQIRKPFKKK
ncbi:MAG: hypothetical protein ACPH2K_04265 [Flavicella sp.]